MFIIEITVIDVESKELHKMEETKGKETKEKMKLSTVRIVVISETCLLIIRHKKKVIQVDPLVYYFYYILGQKSNGPGDTKCHNFLIAEPIFKTFVSN